MNLKQKAVKLVNEIDSFLPCEGITTGQTPIDIAIMLTDRSIENFTDLVNKMDDFSNESRQVIWQLIENEQNIKIELEKL